MPLNDTTPHYAQSGAGSKAASPAYGEISRLAALPYSDWRNHFMISPKVTFLPYMRMPTR